MFNEFVQTWYGVKDEVGECESFFQ